MYLFGLKVRVFQFAVVLGLHPFLAWFCCILSGRRPVKLADIRRWEVANKKSIEFKRTQAVEIFVQKTDIGQLNQKKNPSNKLASLTLLLVLGMLAFAALSSIAIDAAIDAGLRFNTSFLLMSSAITLLAVMLWLLRKLAQLLRSHYQETCFIGQLHKSRGTSPWDGLF